MKKIQLCHITNMSNNLKGKLFEKFTNTFTRYEKVLDLTPTPIATNIKNINPRFIGYETLFKVSEWFSILDDLETICKNYFTISELKTDLFISSKRRYSSPTVLFNNSFNNGNINLNKFAKIELDSIYNNLIYKKIYKKELFFNNRYLEFILPLVKELQINLKEYKEYKDVKLDYPHTLVKIFINYLFGIMGSEKTTEVESNIGTDEIIEYYDNILIDIYDTVKNVIYIDVDKIFISTKNKSDVLLVENILTKNDIDFTIEDNGDLGLFLAKKKYLTFDKNMMNIKQCKGLLKQSLFI